jgi:hypothetical protein
MSTPNTDPIFSRAGDIQWQAPMTTAANDYTCFSSLNEEIFDADDSNGGFVRSIRFKAISTNVASLARIFINNGLPNQQVIATSGTPTGTPATTGGTISTGNQFAKIVAIGQGGDVGVVSTESAAVAVTGPTGSIAWAWTAPSGFTISAYRVHIGSATGAQAEYFIAPQSSVTASQSATTMTVTAIISAPDVRVCPALTIGTVFASGIGAGAYIVKQLTSSEADGSLGKTGTYQLNTSATVSSTTCVTDSLKYQQQSPPHAMIGSIDGQPTKNNSWLYGEVSLPATTASATAATPDVEYPMGIAIPNGYEIYVGLATTVAGGWQAGVIGGKY